MLQEFKSELESFDFFLKDYFQEQLWLDSSLKDKNYKALNELKSSIEYSLFSGGKRFRPALCLLVAKSLKKEITSFLPFAAAVEMIHTYSLIHDDLPCMDDDDERRGQPTNHKIFGEATALLAGDTLLTEAFSLLARSYQQEPKVCTELVALLAQAIGFCGMIGGQVLDIEALASGEAGPQTVDDIHKMKTAALIAVSIEGAAVIAGVASGERKKLKEFGFLLGQAFQVADDILDFNSEKPEGSSYVTLHGVEQTKKDLNQMTQQCIQLISFLEESFLTDLCLFNQRRTH